ncbi:hypothetical protein EJ02DRAFT_404091, partial [Clathrospora elynae]
CTGGLVVRWVTTSEFPLLYVFAFRFFLFFASLHCRLYIRPTCISSASSKTRFLCQAAWVLRRFDAPHREIERSSI